MRTYLLLNILIIAFPLIFTFIMPCRYWKRWPALGLSILTTGGVFIVWDAIATRRGDWMFNPAHAGGPVIAGLPFDEILFFITVPYACLFIYENLRHYFKDRVLPFRRWPFTAAAAGLAILAVLMRDRPYSFTVLLSGAAFLAIASRFTPSILRSLHYWIYLGVSTVLFLIFNGILTSLPVVVYNPEAFSGLRLGTIPLEDFLYNYSLLSFYLLVFLLIRDRRGRPLPPASGRDTLISLKTEAIGGRT